jgi:(1->4)-alpha-D-glucan 1-alpha-D-glucosylmutase
MSVELRATYRLQLTDRFGFEAVRMLVPYFRDLGISHLYLSPCFQARPGSGHGYDVIDPRRISDELGGRDGFERLAGDARDAGLGLVLDVVPNHMAADDANPFWADPELRSQFFDIDPATGDHRRFFDIDDLAGVRQEDPAVFEQTHELALSLVRDGLVDGLRIDHPDGLADPAGYLARLSSAGVDRVWVEKILDPSESLRDWPVSGTVGYEFCSDVAALFVDPAGEEPLTRLWQDIAGEETSFGHVAFQAKLEQAEGTFAREVERLRRIADAEGLEASLASLPVYRTYIADGQAAEEDRRVLEHVDAPVRELLLQGPSEFVSRFQQTTPAIMAKGVEDTAFYRYGRLLALNEVGGDPSRFGIGVDQFHAGCLERARRFPEGLLTTMTHDAKRSADVRARIGALASIPDDWAAQVERWFAVTAPLRSGEAPDDAETYFIFQTLVGTWPIEAQRLEGYMVKALREAKRNTNWVEQNHEYEEAVGRFCRGLYSAAVIEEEFMPFIEQVAELGERAALGQLVLKLTAPGVPDIYQGDELPYRALVDPDNRRAVDWGWRQAMLQRVMGGSPPVTETRKLFLILRLLGLRARKPEIFAVGSYEALEAGAGACAFVRAGRMMIVVELPRADAPEASITPPGGQWRDVLRGEERAFGGATPVARLTDEFGIGVFERIGA